MTCSDELTTLRREVIRLRLIAGEAAPGSVWQLRRNLDFEGWVEVTRTSANVYLSHPDHPRTSQVFTCPTDEGIEEDARWLISAWQSYSHIGDIFRRYCHICGRPFDMDDMDHFSGADDLPPEDYYECRDRDNCQAWIVNTRLGQSWLGEVSS